jgi:hypothetical protein
MLPTRQREILLFCFGSGEFGAMDSPYVYDKAKYHLESVAEHGLPESHAANHTVHFLRWLIENDLMNEFFREESSPVLTKFRAGTATIHDVYNWGDGCMIEDMLTEEGNRFARDYFDFEKGEYIHDYMELLQGDLPSEFHIQYSEKNYQQMKAVIDQRYGEWKKSEY